MRPSFEHATRWWWVRHAPVPLHRHEIYGNRDVECDTSDSCAFASLATALPPDAVWYVSHLRRTHQTARAIEGQGYELPELIAAPAIGEQDFGELSGRRHDEEEARREDPFVGFWPASPHAEIPGGERFDDVCRRVQAFIRDGNEQHAGRDVVCVAHAGPILAALRLALNLDATSAVAFYVSHLSVTRIHHYASVPDGGPRYRVFSVAAPTNGRET
jgi:alpha-ribazole phosphatase